VTTVFCTNYFSTHNPGHKLVQKATLMVLNAIYEEDFLGFSYGFRPGRGQHDALDAVAVGIADAWLPKPRVLHPWPKQRFAVKHSRWEPYAGKPHVRFCAGGAR
jgi:hypothetical protein